jgi:predicted ArsR family transcriptional regulator
VFLFWGINLALRRTWEDFELSAYRMFGTLADGLRQHMQRHHITQHQILCYINWAAGMTHEGIAAHFGISRQAVTDVLVHFREKWPELFMFGNSNTMSRFGRPKRLFSYNPRKHDKHVEHKF